MRRAFWLVPPLLGVAFYVAGSVAAERAIPSVPRAQRLANRSAMDKLPRAGTELSPEQIGKAVNDIATAERQKIATATPAQLKGMILKLVKASGEMKRGVGMYDWDRLNFLHQAANRLGALEGGRALAWLMEHAPDEREPFMDGWADEDAAGAFEAVVRSSVMKPCSEATLMKMLSGFAERSPQLLGDACRRTPWGLFHAPDSFPLRPGISPFGADMRPWVGSGALAELRDRGVDVGGVFQRWMLNDPADALSGWMTGREPLAQPEKSLLEMLDPGGMNEGERAATRAAIHHLNPEDRERLADTLAQQLEEDSSRDEWRKTYPDLIPPKEGDPGESEP